MSLQPDSFWSHAVPVETLLFRNFSLPSREKPLRNGILVIKMLPGSHPATPVPFWVPGWFYI